MEQQSKGFIPTSNQEILSTLIDVGLIIEYGGDYHSYLRSKFYEPMSIKLNSFIRRIDLLNEDKIEILIQKLYY